MSFFETLAKSKKHMSVLWYLCVAGLLVMAFQNCSIQAPVAPGRSVASSSSLSFDHILVASAACTSCHENDRPVTNPPHGDGKDCAFCHRTDTPWTVVSEDVAHNPIPASCSNCHGAGKSKDSITSRPSHISIGMQDCIDCHKSSTPVFADWKYKHNPPPATCNSCHAKGNSQDQEINNYPNHIPMGQQDCVECHSSSMPQFTDWMVVGGYDHMPTPTSCSNCHAMGKSKDEAIKAHSKHIPIIGRDCIECHTTSMTGYKDWTGATGAHNPMPDSCASCHGMNNLYDSAIKAYYDKHISMGGKDCKSCHTASMTGYKDWTGATGAHNPTPDSCASCHGMNNLYDSAIKAYSEHIPMGGKDCISCHATSMAEYKTWQGATGVHSPTPESCASCHAEGNLQDSAIKAHSEHIPMKGKDCIACHSSSIPMFKSWMGGTGAHSPTPESCASCHAEGNPQGKAIAAYTEHIPMGGKDCIDCHSGSMTEYKTWQGASGAHSPIPATCVECHGSDKPKDSIVKFPNHISIGQQDCMACHKSSVPGFNNWEYSHNPEPTTCVGCHGDGKSNDSIMNSPNHISIGTQDCMGCHRSSVPSFANWKYEHSPAPATCAGCHDNGKAYDAALRAVPNHIAMGQSDCISCHAASVPKYETWTGAQGAHSSTGPTAASALDCVSCHGQNGSASSRLNVSAANHFFEATSCVGCHSNFKDFVRDGNNEYLSLDHSKIKDTSADCKDCHTYESGVYKSYRNDTYFRENTAKKDFSNTTRVEGSYKNEKWFVNHPHNFTGTNTDLQSCTQCHTRPEIDYQCDGKSRKGSGSNTSSGWDFYHYPCNPGPNGLSGGLDKTDRKSTNYKSCNICHGIK